jgi:hypothetical protein
LGWANGRDFALAMGQTGVRQRDCSYTRQNSTTKFTRTKIPGDPSEVTRCQNRAEFHRNVKKLDLSEPAPPPRPPGGWIGYSRLVTTVLDGLNTTALIPGPQPPDDGN